MKLIPKRHYVTLIEVLIATVLTMILLTAITFFYRQISIINMESEKLQKEQFRSAYLEKRLSSIIPQIISPTDLHQDFYFFTSDVFAQDGNQSLCFTYNGKVKMESSDANHQLGKLYVDNKKLILASWPSPNTFGQQAYVDFRKEVLMEDVTSLSFEFYVPPKKDRTDVVGSSQTGTDPTPENHWHKTWNYRYNQLPAMIKIHITHQTAKTTTQLDFAFAMPKSNFVIIYDQ
jgi:type II secretory pathway component PulJ